MDTGWAPYLLGRSRAGGRPENSPHRVGTQGGCPSCPGLPYCFWLFDLSTTFIVQSPTYLHCSHPWAQFHFGPSNPQNGKSLLIPFFYFNSSQIHLYLLSFSLWIIIPFVNLCRQASLFISLLSSHPLNQFQRYVCILISLFFPLSCFAIHSTIPHKGPLLVSHW